MRAKILRLGFDLRAKKMISDEKKKKKNQETRIIPYSDPVSLSVKRSTLE